jgi:murein L,D-transpeptidase YcbB/YkuD
MRTRFLSPFLFMLPLAVCLSASARAQEAMKEPDQATVEATAPVSAEAITQQAAPAEIPQAASKETTAKEATVTDIQALFQPAILASMGLRSSDLALLREFYTQRNFAPAWHLNEKGAEDVVEGFITFVHTTLNEHGLNEKSYPFERLKQKVKEGTARANAEAEILATAMVLRMANTLSGQDPVPQSDTDTWPLKREKKDVVTGLNQAINQHRVLEYLESLQPQDPAYARLKGVLAAYRDIADKGGWGRIRPGEVLQPGVVDERVPRLRMRLAQEGYIGFDSSPTPSTQFQDDLLQAVHKFQETHGLYADGHVGPETYRALNVPISERITQIRVNLARMRQSPPDVWENIVVNIPSARLSFYRHGEEVYQAPVVVGRVDRPSPLVSSALYQIVINPSWYVPSSIAEKDLLPKIEADPEFFEKQGIRVSDSKEGGGRRLRQEPGPLNSLGRVKFNFHNPYAVYLHGTPHAELFGQDDRTRSSGCIRLKNPQELALILMKHDPKWDAENLQKKINSLKTQYVNLPDKTPIKLLYWTVTVDKKDQVQFYNDVYGLDQEWVKVL